ncbi:MAG: TRAP transporter substrate-binding protein DctP [Pararhodobacter sp.]
MKHLTLTTAAAVVALGGAVTLATPNSADAQTMTLRFAEFGPNRGVRAEGLEWLANEMSERSDGAMQLDIIWGGALVGAAAAAQAISDGVADMGSVVPVYAPGQLVVYEVVDTLQFPDEWAGMMATYELMTTHPDALAEAEDFNVIYFGNYTTGPTQLLTRDRAVRTTDDLQGLTIRATGPFVPAMEAFGAATVSVSQPGVYEALSSGVVDGSTTYYYTVEGYSQYEVANYMTMLDMGQTLGFGIYMNRDVYMSMSDDQRAMLDQLGRDFTEQMAMMMHASRTDTRDRLAAGINGHSIEMIEPDADARAALIEVAEAHGARWAERAEQKGLDAAAISARFRELVDQHLAVVEEQGYPWNR